MNFRSGWDLPGPLGIALVCSHGQNRRCAASVCSGPRVDRAEWVQPYTTKGGSNAGLAVGVELRHTDLHIAVQEDNYPLWSTSRKC